MIGNDNNETNNSLGFGRKLSKQPHYPLAAHYTGNILTLRDT